MERWTKKRALALQDPFVSQWDKGANLRPLEERIRNTSNESQKVLKGKSVAIDPDFFTVQEPSRKLQLRMWAGENAQLLRQKLFQAAKIKVMEENSLFSWWATDDNEDMFFPALQTAAYPPLALLTKINSCFHLFQCIFTLLPLQVHSATLPSKAEENLE